MSRTPTTPFIPPLLSPHPSPQTQPSPVIPPYTPAGPPGSYPVYPAHSPYATSPFIPPSPSGLPSGAPPQHSRTNSRQGVSSDYTGYPGGYPPPANPPVPPPMHAYGTPHPGYNSAPGGYSTFLQAGQIQPWATPAPQMHSPFLPPGSARIPPYGTPYTPGYGAPLPGAGWGGGPGPAHPGHQFYPQADPGWFGQAPPPLAAPHPAPFVRPEPPSQVFDRMNPFTVGDHYGPVLEPILVKIVDAPVRVNPLISPRPDDGPELPYLKWDMLFETSTAVRSDEPPHMSWVNGRDQPATFPRLTSLRLISTMTPWMIVVKAKDLDRGVTCGEVIQAIGGDMMRLSTKQDFACLSQRDQAELGSAYKRNRSAMPGVPGGHLGQGMRRLDFLRNRSMFGGIEANPNAVKRMCGAELPCVFVLHCAERILTEREVREQEARLRNSDAHPRARSASRGARSRANSVNTRISVHPPSTSSRSAYDGTSDSDDGGVDH